MLPSAAARLARLARLAAALLWVGCAGPPATFDVKPFVDSHAPHEQRAPPAPSIASAPALVSVAVDRPEPPLLPPLPPPPPPPLEPAPEIEMETAASPDAPSPERAAPPKGTVILHVGDSFVYAGLTQRLRQLFEPLGVRYHVRAKASANSLQWARRMPLEVGYTQPDLVIITLGANEIRSKYLHVQARAIRRMVKAIGNRPCVWTTPPLWLEETGLFDTLQANASPCRFFETDRQLGTFLPRRDKIHPTLEAGAVWANKLFDYIMDERIGDTTQPWMLRPSPDDELTRRGHRKPLPVASMASSAAR